MSMVSAQNNNPWSASKLGWSASIIACVLCATLSIVVMRNFVPYPSDIPASFKNLNTLFVVLAALTQLICSTLHHSPFCNSHALT